jgi:hypothetical protein
MSSSSWGQTHFELGFFFNQFNQLLSQDLSAFFGARQEIRNSLRSVSGALWIRFRFLHQAPAVRR